MVFKQKKLSNVLLLLFALISYFSLYVLDLCFFYIFDPKIFEKENKIMHEFVELKFSLKTILGSIVFISISVISILINT